MGPPPLNVFANGTPVYSKVAPCGRPLGYLWASIRVAFVGVRFPNKFFVVANIKADGRRIVL